MPILLQEKQNQKLADGRKVQFNLSIHTEEFSDEDEGCFLCEIKVYEENKIVNEYYRKFLAKTYAKQHFYKFMEKFCADDKYREQFNVIHDKITDKHPQIIDREIEKLIGALNSIGLKTIFCCQGTKDVFSDRPRPTDGHSVLAYVYFQKTLPIIFLKLVSLYKMFLTFSPTAVYAKKRKYNEYFNVIMTNVVEEYKLTLDK